MLARALAVNSRLCRLGATITFIVILNGDTRSRFLAQCSATRQGCENVATNYRAGTQNLIETQYASCLFRFDSPGATVCNQEKQAKEEEADRVKGAAFSDCSSDYSGCIIQAPVSGLCDRQEDCTNTEHCGSSQHCEANQCSGVPPACDFSPAICETHNGTWTCGPGSPIIVDVKGDGYNLTSAVGGVKFDLNGDGRKQRISWTTAGDDDAWLVLDRDGNGRIDSGKEMFGNFTAQPSSQSRNGFLALAEFDKPSLGGNDDGLIDSRDTVFARLRLWCDTNHNGVSEPSELRRLTQSGLESIDLSYTLSRWVDSFGNQFKFKAPARFSSGQRIRVIYDVFLVAK